MKSAGAIILLVSKSTRDSTCDALSYGRDNEPSPNLLLRRGRATLFETMDTAEAALVASLQSSTSKGDTWPKKFAFRIIPVENL